MVWGMRPVRFLLMRSSGVKASPDSTMAVSLEELWIEDEDILGLSRGRRGLRYWREGMGRRQERPESEEAMRGSDCEGANGKRKRGRKWEG